MPVSARPQLPNVLITGTPGTGKTTAAERVAAALDGFSHINVSDLVKVKSLHSGKHEDEELDTFVLDEDLVCDELEEQMSDGGNVVDFHSCDFFPGTVRANGCRSGARGAAWYRAGTGNHRRLLLLCREMRSRACAILCARPASDVARVGPERWFDLVVILRTDNDALYPRLERRGYSEKKIQENLDCEIMCVVAEEARESYKEDIIWELQSNSIAEMDANVARIASQLGQWASIQPSL